MSYLIAGVRAMVSLLTRASWGDVTRLVTEPPFITATPVPSTPMPKGTPGADTTPVSQSETDVLRDLPQSEAAVLQQRISEITRRLMPANSARRLRRLIVESLPAYEPIRHLLGVFVASQIAAGKISSLQDATVSGTKEMLAGLAESDAGILTRQDKDILLDWLQEQARLADVLPRVPLENRPAMLEAVIDGYWSLVGAELAAMTAALVSAGQLQPENPGTPHWLCLEVRRYLKEWRSALFANDPELRRRLAEPARLLTTEEMERRLGI